MSLFELFGAVKEKSGANHEKPTSVSADLSFRPEKELIELIWENGQVMMQGQSSRAERNSSPYGSHSIAPYSLPSHSPKKDRSLGSGSQSGSSAKFKTLDSGLTEFPSPVHLGEMCFSSDDDIAPWFDYTIDDEYLRNDYCSTFLPELSGVSANEPSQNNFEKMKSGNYSNHVFKDPDVESRHDVLGADPGFSSKSSSLAGTSINPAGQTQFQILRPRKVPEIPETSTSNQCGSGDASLVTKSAIELHCEKSRKQNPGASVNRNEFLNFSHFSRPAALYKSSVENNCLNADSSSSKLDEVSLKHKNSAPAKAVADSGQMTETRSLEQFVEEKQATGSRFLKAKPTEEPPPKESEKDNKQTNGSSRASTSKEPGEAVEPAVASSVCSGNGVGSVSPEPSRNLKRKDLTNDDSEAPSEDVEEDSVGLRKSTHVRGSGSKKSRVAEVHNLSERRRRDRINEKMRALQELIPHCNKVDKASMLDEAIEYLKTLQLRVQMMSMGAGLYMQPMMLPAHMAQFSPMGLGVAAGMGFRMGMVEPNGGPTACPIVQGPPVQGAHFPNPVMSGYPALHGMTGPSYPVMGLPGQGLPMPMLHAPPFVPPTSWGQHSLDAAAASNAASKDNAAPSTAATASE